MFHLEPGWWLGVKSCSARAIGTDAEGRKGEVDISVCLAGVQANPRCVCFYLCADWWNELWVWEIDSGWGWSPPHPSACCFFSLCPLIPHHSYLPVSRFGSSHLFPLTKVEGWSQNVCVCVCVCVCGGWGGGHTTQTRWDILFSLSSSIWLDVSQHRWIRCIIFLYFIHGVLLYLLAKSSVFFENPYNRLV